MEASLHNSFLPESPEELKISMDDGIKSPNSKMNSISCESSPKRSRKSLQKRIISVPIAEADGSRLKGDGAPPSDSWAWRKYGQKPIKGSPYPRGYYRCSSSKGCPARKQVERSRLDPRMLVITYASDHNHPWPISKHPSTIRAANNLPTFNPLPEDLPVPHDSSEVDPEDNKFAAGLVCEDFSWLADFPSSLSNRDSVLCNPISNIEEQKFNEDESFFADLGELPECSAVFQWGFYQQQVKSGLTATPVCSGTT